MSRSGVLVQPDLGSWDTYWGPETGYFMSEVPTWCPNPRRLARPERILSDLGWDGKTRRAVPGRTGERLEVSRVRARLVVGGGGAVPLEG
jgi:hypothetical protein